jgi:hypothetical protein
MKRQPDGWSAWRVSAGWLVLLVSVVSGCGKPEGTVTGHVRYKGETVAAGNVIFYGSDNQAVTASINSDGSYTATKVPLGAVKVAVNTPQMSEGMVKSLQKMKKGQIPPAASKTVAVPERYGKPEKSGLELTVTQGSQPFEIELK